MKYLRSSVGSFRFTPPYWLYLPPVDSELVNTNWVFCRDPPARALCQERNAGSIGQRGHIDTVAHE